MLFWLFVILLLVGVACIIVGACINNHSWSDGDWFIYIGIAVATIFGLATAVSLFIIIDGHSNVDGKIDANMKIYESLTYQLENELYENDNDVGKKALYDQIEEWNRDLAEYQGIQDDFWFGIFYPDVFDQFEFIEYK